MNSSSIVNAALAPVLSTSLHSPVPSPPSPKSPVAILDSGSSAHYLTSADSQGLDSSPGPTIFIALPDGSLLPSSETTILPLPAHSLPTSASTAHIVPNLSPHSLLSIGQYCDAGCTATLTSSTAVISHGTTDILRGYRDPLTRLWHVPLQRPLHPPEPVVHHCHAINPRSSIADRIAYYHACCFSPALSTWCTAIDAGRFTSWPELTSALVRKHPPASVAMYKGHLDQSRANQRTTQPLPPVSGTTDSKATLLDETSSDIAPPISDPPALRTHTIYADCQPVTGQIYSDATGRFVLPSSQGNSYILVVYDFDSNMIFAEPMKSRSAPDHLAAFKKVHALLTQRGLKPQLQKLDNEASTLLKTFLSQEGIDFQLAPPQIHRRNAAERAIRTFKNHFIAGLCSTDAKFPLHLWDRLLPQALLTLNLLRGSRINPRLSAYAQVHGAFDFNRTPLAPPGTRVLVHEKPTVRATWAPHAVDGWYLGPALHHYRCFRVWIVDTRAERISDTLSWFPSHVLMPTASSLDTAIAAAHDLTQALLIPSPESALAPLSISEHATLTSLANIFQNRLPLPAPEPPRPELPVVAAPTPLVPPGFPPLPLRVDAVAVPRVEVATVPRVEVAAVPRVEVAAVPRVTGTTTPPVSPSPHTSSPHLLTKPIGAKIAAPHSRLIVNPPMPQSILKLHSKCIGTKNATATSPQMVNRSQVHFHPTTKTAAPTTLYDRPSCPTMPFTYHQATKNAAQRRRLQKRLQTAILSRKTVKQPPLPPHHHNTRFRRHNAALAASMFSPGLQALSASGGDSHLPFRWSANAVIDPDSGTDIPYSKLIKGPDAPHWIRATSLEIGRLAQGLRDVLVGTDTMFFIRHDQKPPHKTATYLRIVAAYKPHKAEPYRIRFTAGGDKIVYPGNVSTPTVDTTTVKCHLNSVVSTPDARYMALDIHNFYLNTPLPDYEYMRIPVSIIPPDIMDQYHLAPLVHNGYVMVELRKGIYGLPQAGILANHRLIAKLEPHGFYPAPSAAGLFLHRTRPISFTLCVDDFGVKYTRREDVDFLIKILEQDYELTVDWTGTLYLGITLHWDYDKRTVDLSMPGYITKALHRFQHPHPVRPQHSPHAWTAPNYGAPVQFAQRPDDSPALPPSGILLLQQIIGTLLYYARMIDNTMLVALGTLASAQTQGTEATMEAATQLLNYCATHPDAMIRFSASAMVLHIHSDASYLSASEARSRIGGYFFLSTDTTNNLPGPDTDPVPFNGPVLVNSSILRNVVASAAEAELGALFINAQDGSVLRAVLADLGHPQPATPIQTDNSCAAGIANDSVRQKRSKAMDMRFFWVRDRVRLGEFHIFWRRGVDNDADYFTKHHSPAEHRRRRPRYLHTSTSAPFAACTLRGCVDLPPRALPPGVPYTSSSPYRPTYGERQRHSPDDLLTSFHSSNYSQS